MESRLDFRFKVISALPIILVGVLYENEPIYLRRVEITNNDEITQMGFFNHSQKQSFEKNFFSMIDPYLN